MLTHQGWFNLLIYATFTPTTTTKFVICISIYIRLHAVTLSLQCSMTALLIILSSILHKMLVILIRTIDKWNDLTEDMVNSTIVLSFKTLYDGYMGDQKYQTGVETFAYQVFQIRI